MKLRNLLPWNSKRKLWNVHGHRVEAKKKKIHGTAAHGDVKGITARRKTYYRCIDCHKTNDSREDFKHETCWDVIEE